VKPAIHGLAWASELVGTFLMVFIGLSVVVLDFGSGSTVARLVPDESARLLITGILFATTGSVYAVTPLGKHSGAHLDPAVTLAFWITGHVETLDLVAYAIAQFAGATAGAALLAAVWGPRAASVQYGRTAVAQGLSWAAAIAIEAAMTAIMVATIFLFTSRKRTARWTPIAVWAVIAVLVWKGALFTGTSLNPARSFGPDLVARKFGDYAVYVAGPLLGASLVALVTRLVPVVYPLTAKLFHDVRYHSPFHEALPTAAHSERDRHEFVQFIRKR
jgi:aquaporin Z